MQTEEGAILPGTSAWAYFIMGRNNQNIIERENVITQKKLLDSDFDDIYQRYLRNESFTSIGKLYCVDRTTVTNFLERNGITIDPYYRWKLKPKDIEEIKRRYLAGEDTTEIGKSYNMHRTSIIWVLKREGIERRNYADCHRQYQTNEYYFDNIDSPEKAYLLGYICADGNVFPKSNTVKLALAAEDKDHLQLLNNLIQPEKPVTFYHRKEANSQDVYSMTINSKHMCDTLISYGIVPRKTHCLKFPSVIPEKYYNSFILGVFDGDGSAGSYPSKYKNAYEGHFSIVGNIDFMIGIKEILEKYVGVYVGIYNRKLGAQNIKILQTSGNNQMLKLMDYLYNDSSSLYLLRKYNKFLKIKTDHENKLLEKEHSKKFCIVCGGKYHARGYCAKHYHTHYEKQLKMQNQTAS